METAMVVKAIYDDLPAEAQVLIDTLYMKWGAEDYAAILLKKAQRVLPKKQAKASEIASELSEIWKAVYEDGTPPDVERVKTLYAEAKILRKEVKDEQTKKGCAAKHRRVYNEAATVYEEDARALGVQITGKAVKATSKLDPAVLARIEERRKAKRSKPKK